jgi:putative endonuclease
MSDKQYYVYMLASKSYGTLYVGVTNDLVRRAYEHKEGIINGFTERYGVHKLVYYETHQDIREAIMREKRIKRWRRDWKINLIETNNPHWIDLYLELLKCEFFK